MKRSILALGLAIVVSMGLVACSSSSSKSTDDGSAATGGSTDVTVKTMDTFKFDPADLTANAGQTVNLTLDNSAGALEHSWVLLDPSVTKEDAVNVQNEGDDAKKLESVHVPAGETATQSFTAPTTPGTYIVVCTIPGHAAGGMIGSLTVN